MYYQKKKPVNWMKYAGWAIQIAAGLAMASYIILEIFKEMGIA